MAKPTSYTIAEKTGLLSSGEIDFLKKLIGECGKFPIACIIGAGSGTSSFALLEKNPNTVIFSIDNEFPTTHRYTPGEKKNLVSAGYWNKGNVIQVWGESQIIGKKWPLMFDFMFIDGDHRYEFIRDDILLWLPKMKKDGIISFHDYGDKKTKPKAGVKQAVDELIINNDNVEVTDLGYIRFTKAFRILREVQTEDLDVYD